AEVRPAVSRRGHDANDPAAFETEERRAAEPADDVRLLELQEPNPVVPRRLGMLMIQLLVLTGHFVPMLQAGAQRKAVNRDRLADATRGGEASEGGRPEGGADDRDVGRARKANRLDACVLVDPCAGNDRHTSGSDDVGGGHQDVGTYEEPAAAAPTIVAD